MVRGVTAGPESSNHAPADPCSSPASGAPCPRGAPSPSARRRSSSSPAGAAPRNTRPPARTCAGVVLRVLLSIRGALAVSCSVSGVLGTSAETFPWKDYLARETQPPSTRWCIVGTGGVCKTSRRLSRPVLQTVRRRPLSCCHRARDSAAQTLAGPLSPSLSGQGTSYCPEPSSASSAPPTPLPRRERACG